MTNLDYTNSWFARVCKHKAIMTVPETNVDAAVAVIRDAGLPHPGEELLDCFIHESLNPEQAASSLLQKSSLGLGAFLADWVELVSACKLSSAPYHACIN
jgi:hypothetical protein